MFSWEVPNLVDSPTIDRAFSEFAHLWESLEQYKTLRSKLHLIILEQLESLKELVDRDWSTREEILATKLKIEEGQDKLILSNISSKKLLTTTSATSITTTASEERKE